MTAPHGPASILIVDDDEAVTQTFAKMLRMEGFEVRTANSAEAAFGDVRDHRPDAIIETPCRVDVLAVKRRPQSKLRQKDPDGLMWAPTKPDGDNIRKAVIDALKSWWRDDALVCVGQTVTVYAERTGLPRVVVRVRTLNNVNPDDIVIPVFTRDAVGGSTAPRQMPLTGGRS